MSAEQWDGRPQNPERDGWHWLHLDSPGYATAVPCLWEDSGWILPGIEEVVFPEAMLSILAKHGRAPRYIAPCLTPSEVTALVEAARREEMEACARHIENWPVEDERMVADECAAAIRARGDA